MHSSVAPVAGNAVEPILETSVVTSAAFAREHTEIPLAMTFWDSNARLVWATRTWLDHWGFDFESIRGRHASDFLSHDLWGEISELVANALKGQRCFKRRFQDRGKLAQRWVENHFDPCRNATGDVIGFYIYAITVDWFAHSEQQVNALSAVSAGAKSPWAYLDAHGCYQFANDAYCKVFDVELRQLIGRFWRDVVKPSESDPIHHAVAMAWQGKPTTFDTLRVMRPTKEPRWTRAEISPHIDLETGQVVGIYLHAQDINDIKLATAAVERTNQRVRAHLDQGLLAVIEWSDGGEITQWSQKTRAMFGEQPRLMEGTSNESHPIMSIVDPSDRERVNELMQSLSLEKASSVEFAARCTAADGSPIWCDWHCTAIRDRETGALSFMAFANDISEVVLTKERLAHQAHIDRLTGLPNRLALESHLLSAIERAQQTGAHVAVIFIDLDRFKILNDTLGHRFGDLLLVAFADRVRSAIKGRDLIARHGGDEFIIVLDDFVAENAPEIAAKRMLEILRSPFDIEGRLVHIGASIGYAIYPEHGDTPETLFRRADVAMYQAKALGRNRFFRYEPVLEKAQKEIVAIERALRRAIIHQTLQVWFQPCLSIATGEVRGVEALTRWTDFELGWVSPAKVFAVAEEIGLIKQLGDYVIDKTCEVASRYPGLTFGINVSVMQLQETNIVETVRRAIADSRCDPSQIEIEVTETRDFVSSELFETVTQLSHELGVGIAIDDFGTGFSNLANLRRLPVRTIKIDRSFTAGVETDAQDRAIVASTIMLAHGLSMRVVAEGVETPGQLAVLRSLNCDAFQGFLVSEAVPEQKLAQLLIERDRTIAA